MSVTPAFRVLRLVQRAAVAIVAIVTAGLAAAASAASMDVTTQQSITAMSVPFVPNAGQWDARAAFAAQTFAGTLFVTKTGELVYSLPGKISVESAIGASARDRRNPLQQARLRSPGWVLSETLVDSTGQPRRTQATPLSAPVGDRPMQGKVSYGVGGDLARYANNIDTFERVNLGEMYPGINVQLRATGTNVEKIFTVAPQQNPAQINIKLAGANALEIGAQGELIAHTGNGPVSFTAPIAFQENAQGERSNVTVAYALNATQNAYRFTLGSYDPMLPLVIDPLLQSTYMGGTGDEHATAMTIHPVTGDVYVAGYTTSTDLPGVLPGAAPGGGVATGAQSVNAGNTDAFVTRFNAALTARLQTSYLGGGGADQISAVVVHPISGEVYVAGLTASAVFPSVVTGVGLGGGGVANGAQTANGGGPYDAFVTRFNAGLTTRFQSTFYGGAGLDGATAMAIHPLTGDVYIAGFSDNALPGVGGAQSTPGGVVGKFDAFVARFNAALTVLASSTYLGGTQDDFATALTIHPGSGEVYLAGYTQSPSLPAISGGAQSAVVAGVSHAFITRFNAALTSPVLQSTFLGGSGGERALGLAIHPFTGEVYMAGVTSSTDLPGTTGGSQPARAGVAGSDDGFVARFNAALTRRQQVTYLGGADVEQLNALAIHPATGDIYVAGTTASNDLPGAPGGAQSSKVSVGFAVFDAFVSRLSPSLTGPVLQSTYMGGASEDYATALAIHPTSGEVYIAGHSTSTDLPVTGGGAQATKVGPVAMNDAFISRFSLDLASGLKVPAAFAFAPKLNVPLNSLQGSNGVQITGVTGNVPVSIVGGNFAQFCVSSSVGCGCDVQAFGNVATTMNNSQHICVRQVAPANVPALTKTTLVVGGGWADFVVTTGSALTSCNLDVDGSGGAPNGLTDGLILVRAMLGFTGTAVTTGAIFGTPPRNTWALIQPYLNANCGTNFLP